MSLSFLPNEIKGAISHLNYNCLSEIRLRYGQPVIIGYGGEYKYLGGTGLCARGKDALIADDITAVVNAATGGCVYNYAEQMKSGFITVEHGVRIGLAGEYVTQNGTVTAIGSITSLNIRIPHDIRGCSSSICNSLFAEGKTPNVLISAKPGMGKTTMLRDLARFLSGDMAKNVLIFDERGEIAAMDAFGNGFDLGERVDVVRSFSKLGAISSAIRAMKPDVIVTDELYGAADIEAVGYAADCGICIIASSHTVNDQKLKDLPFDFFVKLKNIGAEPEIYDKNFNSYSHSRADNLRGSDTVCG